MDLFPIAQDKLSTMVVAKTCAVNTDSTVINCQAKKEFWDPRKCPPAYKRTIVPGYEAGAHYRTRTKKRGWVNALTQPRPQLPR